MKTKLLHKIFAIALVVIGAIACQKELSGSFDNNTDTPVDLGSRVNTSVSGFVTNETEAPVQNAIVKFGAQTVSTDEYGYFEFNDVSVPKNAAMVTVSTSGYFPGIRTFIAKEGKEAFVRIKLLPQINNGTISAANGGNVTLPNGLKIALPENAVVNAATGAAYGGTIHVAAQWIDPTASDLERIMPGDLRAMDAENNMKLLVTYGMAAVELTGGSGEKLQIATGKKATVTWPLPAAVAGSAPATIPLWHFDEAIGLWKEEGSATKTGNTYVGDVSHFSFWNCDVPNNYVQLDMTIVDQNNNPVPYASVHLQANYDTAISYAGGYTDDDGYIIGAVPNNAQIVVTVYSSYSNCGTPLHIQTIQTANSNITLGTITINSGPQTTVSGTVTNCNNVAVTDGALYIRWVYGTGGSQYQRYSLTNGNFSVPYYLCNNSMFNIELLAEDYSTNQQSSPLPHTVVPGSNNIGTIQACGNTATQFLNIDINGTANSFTYPADSLAYYYNLQTGSTINAAQSTGTGNIEQVSIFFDHSTITVGGIYPVTSFSTTYISGSYILNSGTSNVTITEYGAVGEFIAGTYSINVTGPAPTNTAYVITGNFRTRRYN